MVVQKFNLKWFLAILIVLLVTSCVVFEYGLGMPASKVLSSFISLYELVVSNPFFLLVFVFFFVCILYFGGKVFSSLGGIGGLVLIVLLFVVFYIFLFFLL